MNEPWPITKKIYRPKQIKRKQTKFRECNNGKATYLEDLHYYYEAYIGSVCHMMTVNLNFYFLQYCIAWQKWKIDFTNVN